jgi:hypothetical protein
MMKTALFFVFCVLIIGLQSCIKDKSLPQSNLPNGDFEGWSANDDLQTWKTNSCAECTPAYNSYIVQKTSEAYHGQYAVKLLYNGVFPSEASNVFPVSAHPHELIGYAKCTLSENDTVSIKVQVFSHNSLVDSGQWINTTAIQQYKKFVIPITQSSADGDSVLITIRGGNKLGANSGSVLWVDYLCVH